MVPLWDDVNARVRGLTGHLLGRQALGDLADLPDLQAVARRLGELGIDTTGDTSPAGLELAVRRAAAGQVRLLARWLGNRTSLLRVILEDEDRRSVRALLRGAVAGAPAAARLAGLLPTPSLPERLLEELSHQLRARDVAALLTVWRHPFGSPLLAPTASDHPDLFVVEHTLDHAFAGRAVEGAARGGGALRAYVADQVDLANVATALAVAASSVERSVEDLFLPGGRRLSLERYAAAAAADVRGAAAILAGAFDGPRAALLRLHAGEPTLLERVLLADRIQTLGRQTLEDPLGPALTLRYFLQLRAQSIALRAAIWGAALGAPPAVRRGRLAQAV